MKSIQHDGCKAPASNQATGPGRAQAGAGWRITLHTHAAVANLTKVNPPTLKLLYPKLLITPSCHSPYLACWPACLPGFSPQPPPSSLLPLFLFPHIHTSHRFAGQWRILVLLADLTWCFNCFAYRSCLLPSERPASTGTLAQSGFLLRRHNTGISLWLVVGSLALTPTLCRTQWSCRRFGLRQRGAFWLH